MDTIKCPVCGNPGISDYKKEDVICSHCGSDLKIYRTISELSEETTSSGNGIKKYKVMSIVLPVISAIVAIGATCLLYPSPAEENDNKVLLAEKDKVITILNDSVSALNAQILKLSTVDHTSKKVDYIVVKNDSPWRIVNKFYGYRSDWEDIAKSIAEENGIWNPSTKSWKPLRPGQLIKINTEK